MDLTNEQDYRERPHRSIKASIYRIELDRQTPRQLARKTRHDERRTDTDDRQEVDTRSSSAGKRHIGGREQGRHDRHRDTIRGRDRYFISKTYRYIHTCSIA